MKQQWILQCPLLLLSDWRSACPWTEDRFNKSITNSKITQTWSKVMHSHGKKNQKSYIPILHPFGLLKTSSTKTFPCWSQSQDYILTCMEAEGVYEICYSPAFQLNDIPHVNTSNNKTNLVGIKSELVLACFPHNNYHFQFIKVKDKDHKTLQYVCIHHAL